MLTKISSPEYVAIGDFYGDRCAERSKVPLMNHIDEGLDILSSMGVDEKVLNAWCLHPIVQGGSKIDVSWSSGYQLAYEYRRVANAYLCRPETDHYTSHHVEIILGLVSVDCIKMLWADKLQNQKDFRLYNSQHPRAAQLENYFNVWLTTIEQVLKTRQ